MALARTHPDQGWALAELSIRGFRGIQNLTLNFRDPSGTPCPVIVVHGPNGCGKTSVLEAALLLLGGHRKLSGSKGKAALMRGETTFELGLTAVHAKEAPLELKHGIMDAPPKDCGVLYEYFTSSRGPNRVGAVEITAGKRGRKHAETEANRLLLLKQHAVNTKAHEFISGQRNLLLDDRSLLHRLTQAWARFYTSSNESFVVEPVSQNPDEGFDLFLQRPNGVKIPVDDLSSGQLELICLFGWLARTNNDVVFIDEPELHLDQQWHRPLVRALTAAAPGTQFILATHSREIYDAAPSYARHLLLPAEAIPSISLHAAG